MKENCKSCSHKEVCKFREKFEKYLQTPEKSADEDFIEVDIKCKYFAEDIVKITGNSPTPITWQRDNQIADVCPCINCSSRSSSLTCNCIIYQQWLERHRFEYRPDIIYTTDSIVSSSTGNKLNG